MAAALAHAVARNHAFVDGNKRAAFAATATFLLANGFRLSVQVDWVRTFEDLAAGPLTREDLAALLASDMGGDVDIELDD
jgi:death-on-curing protein